MHPAAGLASKKTRCHCMEEPMSMPAMIAIFLLSVSSILGSAASAFSAEKPRKLTPVRIGLVSRSTLDIPSLVARERGAFRKEALEAELVLLRESVTVPA